MGFAMKHAESPMPPLIPWNSLLTLGPWVSHFR
jgi:hypothetical protein